MLISEKFVFTPAFFPEWAGSKHPTIPLVSKAMGEEAEGQTVWGAASLAALGRPVVALVCDPRSWYLALWREGCASRGELFRNLVDPARWEKLRLRQSSGAAEPGAEGGRSSSLTPVPEHWGPQHARMHWYGDSQNVPAFREWLLAVAGMRLMRPVVSSEYGRWPVGRTCGLMSFHYAGLFIHNPNDLGSPPTNWRGLQALAKARGLLTHAVRVEEFATDFPAAMAALGVVLDPATLEATQREQGRTPALRREWARFFDEDMLKMLSDRERFIEAELRYRLTPPKESASEGAASARARRAAADSAGAAAPVAPLDPSEQARQARIAEVRRLQEERLAQRRAAGVLPSRFKLKPAPAAAPLVAPAPAPSGATRRPRLEDFDEE